MTTYISRWVNRLAGWALVVCIFAFASSLIFVFIGVRVNSFLRHVDFPLSDPQDLAVDRTGNIHLILGFYGRVQVYAADGKFLRGYFVPSKGSPIRIWVGPDGNMNFGLVQTNKVLVYSRGDEPIQSYAIKSVSDKVAQLKTAPVAGGDKFIVRNRLLAPEIVKTNSKGQVLMRIRSPWWLWPMIGPVPCAISVAFLVFLRRCLAFVQCQNIPSDSSILLTRAKQIDEVILLTHLGAEAEAVLTPNKILWKKPEQKSCEVVSRQDVFVCVSFQASFCPRRLSVWVRKLRSAQFELNSSAVLLAVLHDVMLLLRLLILVLGALALGHIIRSNP
jgi:hypothetical protein